MKKAPVNESFRRKRRDNQILAELYDTTAPSALLTAIKTVDGSGSGLDADLLDGLDSTAFATAAQGALADSAVQPGDDVSALANDAGYITGVTWGDITGTLSSQTDLQSALDAKASLSGAAFTGPITTSSTIDGRDVAADGTKLDGIESGATADQTASEILTAIKTVDGSTSGLDADLLDGQHASAFASSSAGLPTGGTTGQILSKSSATDYDVAWIDESTTSAVLPSGGTAGQVLVKDTATDYDTSWTNLLTPINSLEFTGSTSGVNPINSLEYA